MPMGQMGAVGQPYGAAGAYGGMAAAGQAGMMPQAAMAMGTGGMAAQVHSALSKLGPYLRLI